MMSNPSVREDHYFINSELAENWTAKEYRNWFERIDLGKVAAIVGDGCRAQVKGLSHERKWGALYPGTKTLYIRCTAHLINLVIKHCTNSIPALKVAIGDIRSIIAAFSDIFLRRELGLRVPDISTTCWIYFQDMLSWIEKHLQAIQRVWTSTPKCNAVVNLINKGTDFSNGMPKRFQQMKLIFDPLKKFVSYVESKHGLFCEVYPRYRELLQLLNEISNMNDLTNSNKQIVNGILGEIPRVFNNEGNFASMKFMFGFTSLGHAAIRKEVGYETSIVPESYSILEESSNPVRMSEVVTAPTLTWSDFTHEQNHGAELNERYPELEDEEGSLQQFEDEDSISENGNLLDTIVAEGPIFMEKDMLIIAMVRRFNFSAIGRFWEKIAKYSL